MESGAVPREGVVGGLDQAIADVEAELLGGMASPEAMAGRCAAVGRLLDESRDPSLAASALERLARVLSRRTGTAAAALFDFVAGEVRRLTAPRSLVERLLEAAGDELRERAVALAADLQAGTLTLQLLQKLGDAVAVGPVLTGTRRPFHVLQHDTSSAEDLVNLAAIGVVQAAEEGKLRAVEPVRADSP